VDSRLEIIDSSETHTLPQEGIDNTKTVAEIASDILDIVEGKVCRPAPRHLVPHSIQLRFSPNPTEYRDGCFEPVIEAICQYGEQPWQTIVSPIIEKRV